jgi:hypothetical protein
MESDPSSRKRVVAMGFFVMAGIAMLLLQWLIAVNNTVDTIPFSQFEQLVAQGSVTEVSVTQDTIQGTPARLRPEGAIAPDHQASIGVSFSGRTQNRSVLLARGAVAAPQAVGG